MKIKDDIITLLFIYSTFLTLVTVGLVYANIKLTDNSSLTTVKMENLQMEINLIKRKLHLNP